MAKQNSLVLFSELVVAECCYANRNLRAHNLVMASLNTAKLRKCFNSSCIVFSRPFRLVDE